ncbi:cilia- and flagella-associated protein 91 [Megachile rotundata]|uniref:cilia- and flagella-associated protein 91 n=1 Tax=Megachile rotundata TaxID=143995 RepID=UPI000614FB0F|nr:PREDICTED: protein MAATS1-like [Megachile rotundata]
MAGNCELNQIICCNSSKYFRRPIIPFLVPKTQDTNAPIYFNQDVLNNIVLNTQKQCYTFSNKLELHRNVGTQTDYRDSESQTVPWEPSFKIKSGHNPEILSIAHLTWNHGLPAGIHEIEIINRMRTKRAWEAVLPPMDTPANIKKRKTILTKLEIEEWAFRESEIQAIQDYRLELFKEISKQFESEKQRKLQDRFDRLEKCLFTRRDKEISAIKYNLQRDLRKLYRKHQQNQQPHKHDLIKRHDKLSSELGAPQRKHEVLQKELLGENYIQNIDNINTLPTHLPTHKELKMIKPRPKSADLCIRETRWTEKKLQQLHSDLKTIRLHDERVETPTLLKRKFRQPSLPPTPYRTITENVKNMRIDQLSTLIQKIVRGRAVQCMMYEGRNRCRELIQELQSSHGLEQNTKRQHQKEKEWMMNLQYMQNEKSMQEDHLSEVLNSLEGMTISAMLDFLSKELVRLEDERRIHAIALLAERERSMREAAEAGRRQLEYNRRREFDEMFRQTMKVNQESVETYLEDIIKEGVEWISDEAAKEYILELCDKVDCLSKYAQDNTTRLAEEEMIANMIYNFILPEVEKNTIRKNIRQKQQAYLQNAHAAIYKQILDLLPIENTN